MLGHMNKYPIQLSDDERQELTNLIRNGKRPARQICRAQIVLKTADGWTAEAISAALGISQQTVFTVRRQAATEGIDRTLQRTGGRKAGQVVKALDGVAEAHLIALTCSEPPEGRERWTLRLLAERMVSLNYVTAVSHETVRQVLKKRNQAVAETDVVHPTQAECRLRGGDGAGVGCLSTPV
jgi:transposase